MAIATLVAGVVAAASGVAVGGDSKAAVVLPLALGVALVLAVLAYTRFAVYVMVMLAVRASIDVAKVSSSPAGEVSQNSAVARGLDPSSILAVLFIMASGLWLAAQHRDRGELRGSGLRRALLAFVAACLLSVPFSARPGVSLLEALRILSIVMMFMVLEQLMRDSKLMRRLLASVYVGALFPLLYTAVRVLGGNPPSEIKGDFTRLTGPFNQSNTFGRYLMLLLIFGVAVYPVVSRRLRLPLAAVLVMSTIFLTLTYTRTALLGTLVGVIAVALAQRRGRVLVALAVTALCAALVVPNLASRLASAAEVDTSAADATGNSLVWRLSYWADVLPLASANPTTGIGLNMTQYNTPDQKQPHNDFIRAYVETGLIGLVAYVGLVWALLRTGRRAIRGSPVGSTDWAVASGFLGCAIAFVAVSVAANFMSNVVTLWYLAAFAAAATAVRWRAERRGAAALPIAPRRSADD